MIGAFLTDNGQDLLNLPSVFEINLVYLMNFHFFFEIFWLFFS